MVETCSNFIYSLPRFKMSEKGPEEFQEILVSPQMVSDHLPHTVCAMLASVRLTTQSEEA